MEGIELLDGLVSTSQTYLSLARCSSMFTSWSLTVCALIPGSALWVYQETAAAGNTAGPNVLQNQNQDQQKAEKL